MNSPQEIASVMEEKTDWQLQEMFMRPGDWTSEALDAAKTELQKRNLSPVDPDKLWTMLCPDCLAPVVSRDGRTARCTTHGGQFQVLFLRRPLDAPAREANTPCPAVGSGAKCRQHPTVPASQTCDDCGTPICATCIFNEPDGRIFCPECATRRATTGSTRLSPLPAGAFCVQHSRVAATAQCKICGACMCDTCKFEVPGGIYICPSCAVTPHAALSPKRKKMLVGSYALAIWSTVVMMALFAGAFRSLVGNRDAQQILGFVLLLILVAPATIGVSLGVGVMDRRHPNSMAVWMATIWNGIILGGFLLLMIIGLMKGGAR
jgi:uncharacterized Zn finger protein (UPF0148 family)